MCYLVAKRFDKVGCVAFKTTHGEKLVELKQKIMDRVGYEEIQLVTISRPSAYGEYEPYQFSSNENEFEEIVVNM